MVLPPGIRPPDSHASRHGQPSIRRKRQCDENSRNEHLARVRLSSSSCGSRPMLLPGINARPSWLDLPGPPWPHHHSSPGPKMRPKMLEESPWQGIGASLGTPPIRAAGLNWRSSQPLATYRLAHEYTSTLRPLFGRSGRRPTRVSAWWRTDRPVWRDPE